MWAVERRLKKLWWVSLFLFLFIVGCSTENRGKSNVSSSQPIINFDSLATVVSTSKVNNQPLIDSLSIGINEKSEQDQFKVSYLRSLSEMRNGQYDKAIQGITKFIESNSNDYEILSLANRLIGIAYFNQNELDFSKKYLLKALKYDSLLSKTDFLIKDFSNLSTVYHFQQSFDTALQLQRKAVNLSLKNDPSSFPASLFFELAPIFIELGELDSAKHYYDLVLQKADTQDIDQAALYINMGLIQQRKSNFEQAENLYKKALHHAHKNENKSDQSLALNNLAYVNFEMGNFEEAFTFLDSAVIVDAEVRDADFAKSIQELELKYEDLTRDRKLQELAFQTERDRSLKTWGGLTVTIIIAALAGLYVTNRKRLQNARQLATETHIRHQKENDLVAMHSSIETLELERKRAAMDLHDGIGALASSVRMRVSLVDARIDKPELKEHLEKADEALQEIAQDVKRIAFNMLPSSLNHLGLVAGIEDFIARLPPNDLQRVHFYADVEQLTLPEANEISLYRICQELINNGVKYSEATDISLELIVEERELVFYYHDNGKGLSSEANNRGNGLRILNARVAFLNGKLDMTSDAENGTTFKITVPK
jgi:two-component system NarL family sensor kinase